MEKNKHYSKLIELVSYASILLSQYTGGGSDHFDCAENFSKELDDNLELLKHGHHEALSNIYKWFAPTCDWDDIVREDEDDLGNQIYELVKILLVK